ncbi:methyltransferase domain-containing protein [Paenarthrobacter sp. NPDC092416]|uniref:methyltransferase domain-containing protein n=1 Tax=Paenarthrobacter sp. NPDC092416 TaxID=3364386 RepID=UPI0038219876
MLSDAVSVLCCPVCQGPLTLKEDPKHALVCGLGHSFDSAKQGYFNLLTGKGTVFEADSADMVTARQGFLDSGHYRALAALIAELAGQALAGPRSVVIDAGTGTGYYLRSILDRTPARAIGLDISKFALRRAARLNPEAVNIVWDVWRRLPIADNAADVLMVVFAPRNPAEFARVLRPGGTLIIVTPRPGHLAEVAARTGMLEIEEGKADRLADTLRGHFSPSSSHTLDIALELDPTELADLAFMGPAGHHLDRRVLAHAAGSDDKVAATAMFQISVFTAPDSGS